MPIEESVNGFFVFFNPSFGVKAFVILFVIFYIIFALIIYRQIQLMAKALPAGVAGLLRFAAILQIGIALAFLFIVIGVF